MKYLHDQIDQLRAQLAAPTPVPGICPKCDDPSHAGECSRARPKWPAAPTPDPTLYQQVGSGDDRVWIPASVAQHIEKAGYRIVPVAPEPSADQCRLGWKREYARAESAEAKLAAARTAAEIGLAATGDSRFAGLRDMLIPAPSPGVKEETV